MIQRNTIFTNVALRPDGTPWWEGHDDPPPAQALDWQGRPWTPASTEKAAHPNSRFTTPATQCASLTTLSQAAAAKITAAVMVSGTKTMADDQQCGVSVWQRKTAISGAMTTEQTIRATLQ